MNEARILNAIRAGKLRLPPLSFKLTDAQPLNGADAVVDVFWDKRRFRFATELKARSTPRSVRDAILAARAAASPPKTYPMVVVPYLSQEQIDDLERQGVSGVDLSGNGVIIVPGELLVSKAGRPNRFPEKFALRNIYRGKVSIAARVFLLRPQYSAVNEIREEVLARGATLAISTVSKVLQRLEEELIVVREKGTIRLAQADKLLEALDREYEPAAVSETFVGRSDLNAEELGRQLLLSAERARARLVLTGSSSVSQYAVMAREGISFYCSNLNRLRETLDARPGPIIEETDRFANVRILETDEDVVYFDARNDRGVAWASPIQTYLELALGEKRDREIAGQIATDILDSARVPRGR